MAARPARPKPLDWSAPAHLTVFVRNLQLLHLDHRDDWPGITLHSLSPSSQNQRQRVRLIEWALYYLFTIWDPEGAQNKLRPFFPPLEPLQSVNLRAALFRALTELKKNGDLGRETILRKTMLDYCKGEKFDELLAGFSTAVLRKLLTVSADEMIGNRAMKLSTATFLSPIDYQNMLPLILAHQVSLGVTGERRARVREAYDEFADLLGQKKTELDERAKQNSSPVIQPGNASEDLVRELRANWLGSEEWATALLEGGSQSSTDAFLELPFSEAWARATDSTMGGLRAGLKQDLVLDLETRVLHQRSRLRRWLEYNDLLRKERGENSSVEMADSPSESRLLFRDHQSLTVASISKAVRQPADRGRVLKEADHSLMSAVKEAMIRINGKARPNLHHADPTPAEPGHSEPGHSEPGHSEPGHSEPGHSEPGHSEPGHSEPGHSELPRPSTETVPLNMSSPMAAGSPASSVEPDSESTANRTEPNQFNRPSLPVVRLSPDRDSSPDSLPDLEPIKASSSFTLAERTRKSMSLIPPLPAHDTQTHPRPRRGPRTSFPVNQFETPRKSSAQSLHRHSRASTPQDQLFEEDADYASVFKSRPRVAHSPISSPAVHVSPSLEDFELDPADADWATVDSPLAAVQSRR
ncbi:hypothetical protein NUU61_010159 [Penicillium alfredii]|uniref:HAUS augmin-like complex subunit 6 N-terminal domain-containing protein n=1 Tax=Penicillium alfredii TaxID=1506179 RepID=A0A9W9EHQ6_9EURO|nr:uncharacterized protein NUU61_010159 [Penicillium alfredii]KAJ5081895.1 hypothetical protein NUU61_010159 [Penicillium alfredii]